MIWLGHIVGELGNFSTSRSFFLGWNTFPASCLEDKGLTPVFQKSNKEWVPATNMHAYLILLLSIWHFSPQLDLQSTDLETLSLPLPSPENSPENKQINIHSSVWPRWLFPSHSLDDIAGVGGGEEMSQVINSFLDKLLTSAYWLYFRNI